jgi:hypothetical protein
MNMRTVIIVFFALIPGFIHGQTTFQVEKLKRANNILPESSYSVIVNRLNNHIESFGNDKEKMLVDFSNHSFLGAMHQAYSVILPKS